MDKTTKVDTPPALTNGREPPPVGHPRDGLRIEDYTRVFGVLEACDRATSTPVFKEQVVEALHRFFAFDDVSFFTGPTYADIFTDPQPLVSGRTAGMLPEYHDRWWRYDVFGTSRAHHLLEATGVASLSEIQPRHVASAPVKSYIQRFLHSGWRVDNAAACHLELPGTKVALIGIFTHDSTRLTDRDIAALRCLARQLSAIGRGVPEYAGCSEALANLTARQREVVDLIAQGLRNGEIAQRLHLAEDSVKKHISRILSATGASNRTELALLTRASTREQG